MDIAGVADDFDSARSSLTVAERLEVLNRWRTSWQHLDFHSPVCVRIPSQENAPTELNREALPRLDERKQATEQDDPSQILPVVTLPSPDASEASNITREIADASPSSVPKVYATRIVAEQDLLLVLTS